MITYILFSLTIITGIFCLRELSAFQAGVKELNDKVESLDNLLALNFEALRDEIKEQVVEHEALSEVFGHHLENWDGFRCNEFQEIKNQVLKHTAVKDYQQDEVNEFVLANVKDWIQGEGYVGDWEVDDKIHDAIANIDYADEVENEVRNLSFTVSID
tara:strand:- start:342 stop:815 length:474 start_codon:yes stop_codon:yes gene_type:complete